MTTKNAVKPPHVMTKAGDCIRQGDVLLICATKAAITAEHKVLPRDQGRVVLAIGESSLHAHVMRDPGVCLLSREGISDRVLTVLDFCDLVLEGGESAPGIPRHDPIQVPPGTYLVRTQREWTGEKVRNAAD
jgi:hypothetical protein